ncbi:alkaline shock response membrane anchor protein AmaP [Streptomyces sp. NPDC004629]|uniref:alkaline shock response membrane anchor protein AmaP n=1 Tax=Streptomyces sp. NPDC004629 TaxID=3364705 RepID=UPI0036CEC6CC
MNRLRSGVNRAVLVCAGLPLAAAGITLGAPEVVGRDRMPSWWPMAASGTVWVDRGALARWREHGWWTPVVVTALAAALLLCLGWCVLQVRSGRVRALPLGGDGLTLDGAALTQAVARSTRSVPGVTQVRVRLLGRPGRLRVRMHLVLDPDASPAAVLSHISTHTLPEAREAVAPQHLNTEIRLHIRRHPHQRVT